MNYLKTHILKRAVKIIFLLLMTFVLLPQGSLAQKKQDLIGDWTAYAPDAPNYQNYLVKITSDSIFAAPEGEPYNSLSTFYKFENDTLKYEIQGVSATVTFESKSKMVGLSVWPGGQSKVFFTRISGIKSKEEKQE